MQRFATESHQRRVCFSFGGGGELPAEVGQLTGLHTVVLRYAHPLECINKAKLPPCTSLSAQKHIGDVKERPTGTLPDISAASPWKGCQKREVSADVG